MGASLQEERFPEGAIFTVGHSTLPIEDFTGLLAAYGIETLADIRTVPRSRHNPQFNGDALAPTLRRQGIDYVALPGLGGLRRPRKDSPNMGWRNESFRGYADYMQTPAFEEAVDSLIQMSGAKRVAIMCAVAMPSLAGGRCIERAGHSGRGNPFPDEPSDAQAHAVRPGAGHNRDLPA